MGIFSKPSDKEALPKEEPIRDELVREEQFNLNEECQFEPDCHYETIYAPEMRWHLQKHEQGQKRIEQMQRTHARRVEMGQMTKKTAIVCGLADRYFHITIEMQDFERTEKFIKEVFDKLDAEDRFAFVRYLGGRMITVGQQMDQLVASQQTFIRLI